MRKKKHKKKEIKKTERNITWKEKKLELQNGNKRD